MIYINLSSKNASSMNQHNWLIFFILYFVTSCGNTTHRNSSYNTQYSYSKPIQEEYLTYATDGFERKYFDEKWNIIHYKSKASFYREAYYKDGLIMRDSITRDYYINGKLQFEGYLKSESPDEIDKGTWYNENGKISATLIIDAKRRSEKKLFYDNGNIESLYYLVNGTITGKYTGYYEDGSVSYVYNYKKGERDGLSTEYHKNGKVSFTYYHKKGILNGTVVEYYESGKRAATYQFKNGKKEGIVVVYYENGQIKYKANYINDLYNGEYKSYYDNGKIKSKGSLVNGDKIGVWDYYDLSGNVSFQNHSKPSSYNYNYDYGYSRYAQDDYEDLKDECEYLESVLDEANIDHDYFDSSMDYDDLENLRDDYQNLLEDNDVDY